MKEQAGSRRQIVDLVLNEVAEAIRANEEDLQIYTGGTTNIFKYPELSDGQKASELLGTLEQKELLKNLFADEGNGQENTGIQVYIGDETPVQSMKDCSVVTANYVLGDGLRGRPECYPCLPVRDRLEYCPCPPVPDPQPDRRSCRLRPSPL